MPVDPAAIRPDWLYTFTEAAALAGVTRRTVENWRSRGLFAPAGSVRGRRNCLYVRGADLLRVLVGDDGGAKPEAPSRRARRQRAAERKLRELGLRVGPGGEGGGA